LAIAAFTVRAALQVPPMRVGLPEVLAGQDHLDRAVRWVHAGEVAHMPALLKGGELLLTTGMGIGSTAADQRRFVQALAERGVTALAVELGAALPEVPRALVAEAESHGLPLIAIRREVRFVEITEVIHREIVNRQVVLMRRGDEIQQRFTDMMLDGAGIPELLGALAETIANPVFLEKSDRGVVYHATHHSPDAQALAAWDEVSRGAETPAHAALPVRTGGGEAWGRLWALGLDSPLEELDRVAVERAVGLIALALLRSRQEDVLAVRQPGRFLSRLLESDMEEAEAREGAAAIGFTTSPKWLLPMVATRSGRSGGGGQEAIWALVWRDLRRDLEGGAWPMLAGTLSLEQDLAIVIGLAAEHERPAVADRVATMLHAAADRHFAAADAVTLGVGRLAGSWGAVSQGLREAVEAATAPASGDRRAWYDAGQADLGRLLWTLRDNREMRAFVDKRLGRLIEHDRNRSFKLLDTLRVYFAHNGHKAAAARVLHVERQSLYHRLERIEEVLGESLDDEDTYLGLHLALRAHDQVAAERRDG
jgi:PucR family transcriptional regulator, purine catabolism regulatory protein